MFSSIFIVLFALFAIVIAHNKEFVHRRYRQLPRLLTKGETDLVHLRIGLKHDSESIQKLKTIADHVSDPTHPNYGKYLNVEEIKSILHSKERESTVMSWLKSALGVKQVKTVLTGDWLEVVAPAARVEQAFGVELRWFEHNSSKRRVLKTLDDIQLPSHVKDHIEIVVGLTDFFDSKTERKASMMSDVDVNAIKDTSPEILPTRGSENRLEVTVKPYDANGDPFRHMAPNDELRVTVLSNYGEYHQRSFKLQDDSCELTADGLMCGLQFVMNTAFSRVNITAQTAFNHGHTSPISSYFINGTMAAWVDPSVAYQTYKVPHGEYNTFKHNSQAVVAFEQQYVSMVDLEMFHDLNGLPFNRSLVHIHGPNDPTKPGGESTLDLQWIMATGRNVETHFLSFCGPGPAKGPCGAYILDWAIFVANSTRPPLVTSISYGDTEQGYFNKFGSWSYFDRMENELMKMAVRGLTVFAGSGDAGATNVGEAGNDISPTDPTCGVVRPFFPSDSHYVVSLSASLLTTQTTKFCNSAQTYEPYHRKTGIQCSRVGEKSVSLTYGGTYWTTGGGFSHRLGRPSFQHAAVEAYLQQAQGQLPANFNRNGRAYADLTALGFNLNVVLNRVITPIGGTSASGPLMAGIFSLLNGRQLQRRGTSLGNPLPWIYTTLANTPGAFNDLTYGRNDDGDFQKRGSPYPSFCPGSGYPLTTGFDAVSGWGSINYDVVVANLP